MASDDAVRKEILLERERNVVIDAGAGSGKTEMIVRRFVELIAPTPGAAPVPIGRMAAITFTRRAAGELKYRIREKILGALETGKENATRRDLLRAALAGLDSAHIGTIHSFADRLLRLRPAEARLSPGYEIAEDVSGLVSQVLRRLTLAAERGDLAAAAGIAPALATEFEETLKDYVASGFLLESESGEHADKHGLDALVGGMLGKRDLDTNFGPPSPPDFAILAAGAKGASARIRALKTASEGQKALLRAARDFDRVAQAKAGPTFIRAILQLEGSYPSGLQMAADFGPDDEGWELKKELQEEVGTSLAKPVKEWMIARLARLQPAVVGIYEALKRELEVVDQTDLLLKLREVLRIPEHRRFYAGLFDHVFVDEFQDTDPIQTDILKYLVGDEGAQPRAGTITIVGDAKQSIYRFRRADIEAYGRFRDWLAKGGALVRSLVANFRSAEPIITYVNNRFSSIMEPVKGGVVFDAATGRVFYEDLTPNIPGRGPAVEVIPIAGPGGTPLGAGDGRPVEAEALARYLVHLRKEKVQVRAPGQDGLREVRWGDIVVLSYSTYNWPLLFSEFDRFGIPYAARGGKIFAQDPIVRSFILALRLITDPRDGLAAAAYHRPPYWLLSMEDLVGKTPASQAADDLAASLRRERLSRPPGDTARDLLHKTRCHGTVEGGANGAQNLNKLRELIQVIDGLSREGKDFDAVTTELLDWIASAPQLDAPEPVGEDVVRFLTTHQAKGLEYPVVVLWDSFQEASKDPKGCWIPASSGTSAAIQLDDLRGDVPAGSGVLGIESMFGSAEMDRLTYVAVTRARDLFILASPTYKIGRDYLYQPLVEEVPGVMKRLPPFRPDALPDWAKAAVPIPRYRSSPDTGEPWRPAWEEGLARASKPLASPLAITQEVRQELVARTSHGETSTRKRIEGRYGALFGTTVHRALQMLLGGTRVPPQQVTELCAKECGLSSHLDEAHKDVARALAAVEKIPGKKLVEFPVATLGKGGELLEGYIDLLAMGDEVWVVDYKTDQPPAGDVAATLPEYAAQIRCYAKVLSDSGSFPGKKIRTALLFTASGALAEVSGA